MKTFVWVITAAGAAFLAYAVLMRSQLQFGGASGEMEGAALRSSGWGAKQRISGAATQLGGDLKEGLGRIAGNDNLAAEGIAEQAAGTVKSAAGNVAQAVGQTIHELNRQ